MVSDQTPLPPPRARRHRIPPHPPSFPSLRFPIPCIQKRPRISLIVSATQHRTHLRPPSLAKAFPTHSSSRQQPHPTNTTSYFTLLTYLQTFLHHTQQDSSAVWVERVLLTRNRMWILAAGITVPPLRPAFMPACHPPSFHHRCFLKECGTQLTSGGWGGWVWVGCCF